MNIKTLALATVIAAATVPALAADLYAPPGYKHGSIKDGPAPSPHQYYAPAGGIFIDANVGQVWKGDFSWTVGEVDLGFRVPRANGWAWTPHLGYVGSFGDATIDHGDGWTTSASFGAFKAMPLAFEWNRGGLLSFNLGAGYTRAWMEGSQDFHDVCGCAPDESHKLDVGGNFATLGGGLNLNITDRLVVGAKLEYNVGLGGDTESFPYLGGGVKWRF